MKRILFKNSISGIFQLIITTALTFIVIPVFIVKLGAEKYGVFSIISVIGNLNIFSNLGLNTALVRYVAEQGKTTQSDHDIAVTFMLLHVVIIPLSILAYVFSDAIFTDFLNIPTEFFQEARPLFLLLLISNYLLLIGQCFVSVINALQKMYISNFLRLLYSFLYWGSILIMLFFAKDLKYIGLSILFAAIVYFILLSFVFLRLWGLPNITGLYNNFIFTVKKQFSYSAKIYSANLLSFMFNPLTKILISKYFGLHEVGYYDIALRFTTNALKLLTKPVEALFPMQAQIKDNAKSRLLVHDIEQKSLFFITPIIVAIFFLSKPFIQLWLGTSNNLIVNSVIFLSISYLISQIATPNYQYLIAKGFAEKVTYLQFVNVLVNLFFFFILFKRFGYYSAVISNCTAIVLSFSLNLYYQKKYLDSLIFDSSNQFTRFFLSTFSLFFITYVFDKYVAAIIGNLFLKIGITGIFIVMVCLLLYRYYRLFTKEDADRYFSLNARLHRTFMTVLIK